MSKVRRDKNSQRTVWLLIFVAVSIFVIIFFGARGRFTAPVSGAAMTGVLAPFQRALSWAGYQINAVTASAWELVTAYQQNEMLKNEVLQLRQQNLTAAEYAAENERLRNLLGYKQVTGWFDLMAAQVIGREQATWTRMIAVNRGSSDGVAKNMPVVTEKGLVGLVVEVAPNASKVQLILDPRSSVGTLVQRSESRVAGIVQGNMEDSMKPNMINIPKNSDVLVGDTIITSGFGGIFPKGIIVGKVDSLKDDSGGLLEIATLEPAVDFQKLEDVLIVTAAREAPPAALAPPPQTPGTESDKNGNFINQNQDQQVQQNQGTNGQNQQVQQNQDANNQSQQNQQNQGANKAEGR